MESGKDPKIGLAAEIITLGNSANDPQSTPALQARNRVAYEALVARTKTMTLMPILTTLLQPGRVAASLRPDIMQSLSLLPLRPKGVRNTIEFVLSIHPSSAGAGGSSLATSAESKGSTISLEALNSASRLLSSPPTQVSAQVWFSGVGPQLLSLLDGEGGMEMIKVASYIIGYGILGRKQTGAPGTPGWKAFAEPLVSPIDPNLGSENRKLSDNQPFHNEEEIVSLKSESLLVTPETLSEALRRLASLLSSHPNPGLSKRLLEPLLLPLWSLWSWPVDNPQDLEEWRAPAGYLLQILLQVSLKGNPLLTIVDNLLFRGCQDGNRIRWSYRLGTSGGLQVERSTSSASLPQSLVEKKVRLFIELIQPIHNAEDIPALFSLLCERWLSREEHQGVEVTHTVNLREYNDMHINQGIIEMKVLQHLMDKMPERLIGNTSQVLELATGVLQKTIHSGVDLDQGSTVAVALSLLNIVITSANSKRTPQDSALFNSVRAALSDILKTPDSQNAITAQNLISLIGFQEGEERGSDFHLSDKSLDDRRVYDLAMLYMTGRESPPPVRAQGISLITSLIGSNSSVLDIPATLVLLSSILQDEDEYIYLQVIKALVLLSAKHPRAVSNELLDRYIDSNEDLSIDTRLRFGECLLQVIERSGSSFTGDFSRHISGGLLSVAGRRGYRPKTEAQQVKKAAIRKSQHQEAENAWNGEVPVIEETTDNDEILLQIVEGWESKRGQEDVRIRTSALSVFGAAMEANIAGMNSSFISSAIDMSVNILALESAPEKAILRRAAILLIMSLLSALDEAQENSKKLGFGLVGQNVDDITRILRYIEDTDGDGLVRQHAKDVIEGLETWKIKSLIGPPNNTFQTQLGELAGLSVNTQYSSALQQRPRIEELD